MSALASPELKPGFSDAVFDGQASFRALLDAMSYPGRVQPISAKIDAPSPLHPATGALALTVLDFDTRAWVDPSGAPALEWLRFHAGVQITQDPCNAQFALVSNVAELPALDEFALGEDQFPDRSATLFIQVEGLVGGPLTRWTGPGIDGDIKVAIAGLPSGFWAQWALNGELFPLGVDVVFVCGQDIMGLPRSIKVEV